MDLIRDTKHSILINPNICIRKVVRPSRSKKKDNISVTNTLLDDGLRSYYQMLEEREENARNIWNRIRMDISKRRSGKIKTHFPVMRIKTIMKLDPDVGPVSRDAAAALSFVAELFIHELASLAWIETEKRCATVMTRPDIFQAVRCFDHFDFLADVLPFWKYAVASRRGGKGKARGQTGRKHSSEGTTTTKLIIPDRTELGRVGSNGLGNYTAEVLVYPATTC